ncbi:MAG: DUF1326 domain-containing protein [Candidatus Helarchaeota archaeon]|nr:DUF1326 domain-containing protein [Candidatus Helarchaeota archaeon]
MSKTSKSRLPWKMIGTWYEACAAEGHCSMYFGRDLENPCKSFQLFQIKEGQIGDIDISGILVIQVIDLISPKFADLMLKGGEGGIYISESATTQQKELIEPFLVKNVPGFLLLRKALGIRYVNIDLNQENNTFHITMPYGEMKLSYTPGGDGKTPQRLENSIFSVMFSDIKICNTHFWNYNDFGKTWEFQNRSGAIAEFILRGKSKI